MSGRVFTYPINEKLTTYDVDALLHYSAYRRVMELLGEKVDVNVIIYSLSKEEVDKIRSIDSNFKIIDVEDYLEDLNDFIGELYHSKKLKIVTKKMFFCEKCNEYYPPEKVEIREFDIVYKINKVRIARRTYFIDKLPSDVEPIAVAINENEPLIYTKIDKETWISPASLKDVWINDLEIPEGVIKEGKLKEIRSRVKLVDYVVTGKVTTGFITKDTLKMYNPRNVIPSYSEIYSLKTHVRREICPVCGEIVKEHITPFLTLDTEDKIKLSSTDGAYKIPVLYCENCGHMEYGTKIRDCPECGNVMDLRFTYDQRIIPMGVYFTEIEDPGKIAFLHEKRQKFLLLDKILSGIGKKISEKTKILRHRLIEGQMTLMVLTKSRGNVATENRKMKRIRNLLENLVHYMDIYGTGEAKDILDRWMIYRNETFKKEFTDLLKSGNFVHGFDLLYDYIVRDISRFYIGMKRKEPVVRNVILDAIKLFYVYDPEFSKSLLEKLDEESITLKIAEPTEVRGMEVVRDVLRRIMEFRNEREIPRREPLKKIVFVSDRAGEIKEFSGRIMKFANVLMFNATDKWDEMELSIEPNLEAINRMYRAWAPKIAFLLRRKNVKEVMNALDKGGYSMGIEGFIIKITPDMVKYVEKVPKGYIKLKTKFGTLYIYSERDITTMRIRMVNEIIRRINSMRRDLELEYDDVIDVSITTDDYILRILKGYADEIRERTRARNVDFKYIEYGYVVEWPIGDFDVIIGINPLFKKWVIKAFQSIPGIAENKAEMLFHMGYGSIYELMQASPTELAEIPGFSLAFANKVHEYLYATAFKSKKKSGKEYCPFCEAELDQDDDFCPRCGAPIRVEVERKEITEGNIYLGIGEFSRIVNTVLTNFPDEKKLVITKEDPDTIKKEYNLKNTNVIWISYVPMAKSIKPKEIEKLLDAVEKNIGKGAKIILMDSFEFMLAINGIDKMLEFLKTIREDIKNTKTILMFNVEEIDDEYMEKIEKYVDGKL